MLRLILELNLASLWRQAYKRKLIIVWAVFSTFCRKRCWDNFKDILKSRVKETESHSVVSDSLWPKSYRVDGILQAGILEWLADPFFRGSSQPRDQTQVSCIAGGFFIQLSQKTTLVRASPIFCVCVFPSWK